MKILVVTQYFWPENFKINDLCIGLKERGNQVTILTGKPNYPFGKYFEGYSFFSKNIDSFEEIKVYRTWLYPRKNGKGLNLVLNYLSFVIFGSFRALLMRGDYDRILVYEPSPITVGIPAIVAKWKSGAKMYFWVQDLWPDSITAAGGIKNKYILNFVDSITRFIYHCSDKLLLQSRSFIPYVLNQRVPHEKLIYYPNSTESYYNVVPIKEEIRSKFPQGFNLLFAGNIGEAQSFDTLIESAIKLYEKSLQVNWIILGDGRMKKQFEEKVENLGIGSRFLFLGSFPSNHMPDYFRCADALLISLKKDKIFSMTIPSKLQSYMACGRPIIGSLDGEGASIIEEAQAGIVAPAEDVEALTKAIESLIDLPAESRDKMGANARKYFEQEFEREILIDKLEAIFQDQSN